MSRRAWWRICLVWSVIGLMVGTPPVCAWDKNQIQQNYQNTPKGLIIWNGKADKSVNWYESLIMQNPAGHDTLLQFCQVHHINRIYLFIGSWQWEGPDYFSQNVMPYNFAPDLAALVGKLRNNIPGVRVYALYYLYDDQDRLREGEIENVAHIVNTVIAYNQAYADARFDGIMGDCEPDDSSNYPNYLTMNHLAKQAIGASALAPAVTLRPKWNNQNVPGTTKTMNQAILDSGDVEEVVLMDYANWRQGTDSTGNYAGCVNYATPVFTYAEDIFKNTGRTVKVSAALETGWLGTVPQVTFANLNSAIGFENFFLAFRDLFQGQPGLTPQFSGYSALYPGVYDMMVIHDYSQFFSELYQVDPYNNTAPITALYTRPSPTPGTTVIYWPTNDTPSPSPPPSLHHINLLLLGQ